MAEMNGEIACKDCGQPFTLGASEIAFFERRGLSVPRRCRECRAYRRQERAEQDAHGEPPR